MKLCKPFDRGHAAFVLRELNPQERRAVFDCFKPGEEPSRLARALLEEATAKDGWLLCDCRIKDAPVLFPRAVGSSMHWVRAAQRNTHAPGCPLADPAHTGLSDSDKRILERAWSHFAPAGEYDATREPKATSVYDWLKSLRSRPLDDSPVRTHPDDYGALAAKVRVGDMPSAWLVIPIAGLDEHGVKPFYGKSQGRVDHIPVRGPLWRRNGIRGPFSQDIAALQIEVGADGRAEPARGLILTLNTYGPLAECQNHQFRWALRSIADALRWSQRKMEGLHIAVTVTRSDLESPDPHGVTIQIGTATLDIKFLAASDPESGSTLYFRATDAMSDTDADHLHHRHQFFKKVVFQRTGSLARKQTNSKGDELS